MIIAFNVAIMSFVLVCFTKHIGLYRRLVESLDLRGLEISSFRIGFLNYGTFGCIFKLKDINRMLGSELSENERRLMFESKRAYSFATAGLVGMVCLWVVAVSIGAIN
ncbi:hypothetical protein [Simiduia agarivorans]|uniref:hypothetical protein n=1 Tax=Simiduia agarivorans TaxID=447471 RepID=UPI001182C25F|nr:hypothetical protein [Simiduia agarivorans]